jgi:cytochrome P450
MISSIADESGNLYQASLEDPYRYYRLLREHGSIIYDESLRGWVVARYADIHEALASPYLTSDRTAAYLSALPVDDRERFGKFASFRSDMLLFCDGAKHRRIRAAIAPMLDRAVVAAKDWLPGLVQEFIKETVNLKQFDVMETVAAGVPLAVLLRLLGLPPEDASRVRSWATAFNRAIGGVLVPALVEQAQIALEELTVYFEHVSSTARKRSALFTELEAQVNRAYSRSEMIASFLTLVVAGHETTMNFVGNAILALLQTPGAWPAVHDLRSVSIEELLRFDSPVQLTTRATTASCNLGGRSIRSGVRILLLWGSANRDPDVFTQPDVLDMERRPNRHLAFGAGSHQCPGAALARMQAREIVKQLHFAHPNLALEGFPTRNPNFSFRGLKTLPVLSAH